jgi:serine/threonine protein kinase
MAPWTIVAPLGEGGTASVGRARRSDRRCAAECAIQLLHGQLHGRSGIERCAREGRLLARLDHPKVEPLLQRGDSLKSTERMQTRALKPRALLLMRQPVDALPLAVQAVALARQGSKAADRVTLGQMLGHLGAVQAQLPAPNGAAQTLDEALSLLRPALGDKSLAVEVALKLRG